MSSRRIRFVPRNPIALAALAAIAALVVLAVVAPIIWGDSSAQSNVLDASKPSSSAHLFGTDQLGRDLFQRTLVATRLSLLLALAAALIGTCLGIPFGILPSVLGGRARRLVAGVISGLIALPGLLLALFVGTIIGVGATGAVVGIGIANAPTLARLSQTLSAGVAVKDYVAAARMLGASRTQLVLRHVLPNVAEPLILTSTMSVGWCLLEISALSFLGLGVRAPAFDWGALLNEGLQGIYVNPMGALGPGAFVVIAGLAFALLGESLTSLARRTPRFRFPGRAGKRGPAAATNVGGRDSAEIASDAVLQADGLTVMFPSVDGPPLVAVNEISLAIERGEKVGIVGESGSGKSLTALAVSQLVDYPGRVTYRELRFDDVDLRAAPVERVRRLLGSSMALVWQDPMTALNPALRVGGQLAEVARVHGEASRKAARARAVRQLDHVHINEPEKRARQFPYELSGGMRQRAVIAMGLMGDPKLIIADEPTTALDVTVQKRVLDLLEELNAETGTALLLISHDIAVVSNVCDRVLVMYGGRIVEDASVDELLAGAAHPYARALLAAVPTMTTDRYRPLTVIPGRPPTLHEMPPGCPFAARCAHADDRCRAEAPELVDIVPGHRVACWHPYGRELDAVRASEGAAA